MPELPEVETMRRGILDVVGCRIANVRRPRCRRKPIVVRPRMTTFRARALGQRIDSVDRIGKRVVLQFASQDVIVFEPRMTGLILLADPPSREHLRFCLELDEGPVEQLWYWDRRGLGSIRLVSQQRLTQLLTSQIGPDALCATVDQLRAALAGSRRQIKPALLDQRAIAGIGNLYASEILHVAQLDPQLRCHRMTGAQWDRLHRAMRNVLREAIRYEGSTLADGTYRNALNQAGTYQNHHRVYGRAGEVCLSCGQASIVRIIQMQRATFFCPACQAPRRRWRTKEQENAGRPIDSA